MKYLNSLKDEIIFAAETHLNNIASLKMITEARRHDRHAAASPAVSNPEDIDGYSAGRFVSTAKHMDTMVLYVGVEGLCPNPRLITAATRCDDTCVINAGCYLYVGMG